MPRRTWLHFVPFAAYVITIIPTYYVLTGPEKIALFEEAPAGTLNPLVATVLIVRPLHMLLYSANALVLLRRFQQGLREEYSNVGERDLHRSATLLWCYIAVTAITILIITVSVFTHMDLALTNGLHCLLLSACIYGLAYANLKFPLPRPAAPVAEPPEVLPATTPDRKGGRRVHNLNDGQFAATRERMVRALEQEKAYLDNDLTLAVISERMQVPAYQVSEAINRHYQSTFFDTVNRLRVEEVKRKLADPGLAHYSILGIAMDSGFSSKSSFNEAFRKHTGTTPSAFRKT